MALAAVPAALADDLGTARLQIAGTQLTVDPVTQTVPFDTPTIVETNLEGYDPAYGTLPSALRVLADFSGPEVDGIMQLETVPNEPFRIPRLQLEGEYALENIRLVQDGEILAYAEPRSATVKVTQILLTSVSSRALTLDEMRAYGLAFDEDNFQAMNLTFAFGAFGRTIEYGMPVVFNSYNTEVEFDPDGDTHVLLPLYGDVQRNTLRVDFIPPRAVPFKFGGGVIHECLDPIGPGSFSLATSLPHLLGLCEIKDGGCDPGSGGCREKINPDFRMVGVLLFPTDINLLHQYFSVVLMVQNGADETDPDPLVLRDLFANIILPPGLRLGETEPPTLVGTPVPIRNEGPDGELGTADDVTFIVAQATGSAEYLVEGLQEGTHIVSMDIAGTLEGMPSGTRPVTAKAQGAVAVRDHRLQAHIAMPQIVRYGIEYSLYYTITNIGTAPVNLISLTLPSHAVSGVTLLGPDTQTIESLNPGDSATVEFRVESQRTGRMISSSVKTGSYINPTFEWSVSVGDARALSPDVLSLPAAAEHLPRELLDPALGLVGLGYSLAQAPPSLSSGLPRVGKTTVTERIYSLSQGGRHLSLGEDLFDLTAVLATELIGSDWAWDQLRRDSRKGGEVAAAVADVLSTESATAAEAFDRFAATTHYLKPQLVLGDGAGVTVEVASRTSGKAVAGSGLDSARLRDLPFAELYDLEGGELVVLAAPEEGGFEARLRHASGGTADLHLMVPDGAGDLRAIRWSGVSLTSAGEAVVAYQSGDTVFTLEVDGDGDGVVDSQEVGIVETLTPRPFEAIAAVQVSDVDPSGHVLEVIFTEPVDLASLVPRDPDHFQLPNNFSNGGLIELEQDIATGLLEGYQTIENPFEGLSNPSVVQVVMNNPVSPLIENVLTVADLTSATGRQLVEQQVPVTTTAPQTGSQLIGTLYGPDGLPVPTAQVALYEKDKSGVGGNSMCTFHPTAATTTDANGQFHFEYVRLTACGGTFRLKAQDPVNNFFGEAVDRVRVANQTIELDILMPGRGRVEGQVRYSDGTIPDRIRVIVSSRNSNQNRHAHVDAETGRYDLDHLVVGTIVLAADDTQGNFFYKTIELPERGAVVEQDLVLLRRDELNQTPPGSLRGTVVETDGTPVYDAYVTASYEEGVFAVVQRTDAEGRFDLGLLPTGVLKIEVFNEKSTLTGITAGHVWAEIESDRVTDVEVILRSVVGAVEGHVYRKAWNGAVTPVGAAVVWVEGTPFNTVTDESGYYRFDDMFEGTWNIVAADAERLEGVQEQVTITSAGGVMSRDLYFLEPLPLGGVMGQVLDYDGSPVSSCTIHLSGGYMSSKWHHETHCDGNGYFKIEDLPPSRIGVHAMTGNDGGVGWGEIRYPGDTAWVTVRYRKGVIRGRTVARNGADGSLVPVLSQIAYRATEVHEWGIVVFDDKYNYMETDPDGYFEIPALNGPYELRIYNAFHGWQAAKGSLDYDGHVVEHEFIFETNGTIRGVLYNYDGVTPAAGATVNLTGGTFSAYDVQTDEEGRFEFPLVPPAGYQIEAFYQDGAISRRQLISVTLGEFGQEIDVEMVLRQQGSVIGWVEDSNGVPQAGAVVTLQELGYPWRRMIHNADGDGNFAFDAITVGEVSVHAQSLELGGLAGRARLPLTSEAEEAVAVVALEDVGELVGRLFTPVDGSTVPLAEVRLGGGTHFFDMATSGDDGEYRFRLVPLGFYQVRVYDPATGRSGRSEWVEVAHNNHVATADTLLEARGVVEGVLYDEDTSQTVPGAIIRMSVFGTYGSSSLYAVTDLDGYFEFGGIRQGDVVLRANDFTGRRNASASGTVTFEDEVITVDLFFAPTSRVTGQVLNPPGLPDGPFTGNVNLRLVQDRYVIGAGFDNPYEFDGLVVDKGFKVIVEEVGGIRRGEAVGHMGEAGEDVVLDIRMQAIGSVTIEVVDSFGNPVPGADILMTNRHDYGSEQFFGSTGDDHTVTFADIREGQLWARATDPLTDLQGIVRGSLVSEGEAVTLEIVLQDSGWIRGRAVLADGFSPAPYATVALLAGGSWYLMETDEDGFFGFEGIPMGSYELSLEEDDGFGIRDVFGALTANGQIVDYGNLALDVDVPLVVDIDPPSGERDLPLDTAVTVTFSEPMDASREAWGTFILKTRTGAWVPIDVVWSADQTAATMVPQDGLASGTTYDVYIAREVYDLAGRPLDWRVRTSFYTADVIPPAVIDTLPRAGDVQVPYDTMILVTFSEPVELTSLSGTALQLTDLTTGQGLTSTFQLRPSEREIIVTPVVGLLPDHDIQLTVQGVADLAGNVMPEPVSIVFWTPDETLPQLDWLSPADGATFTAGDTVAISAEATDNRGVSGVTFSIGDWSTTLTGNQQTSDTFAWNVPAPIVATTGNVDITALLSDRFGNQQTFTRTIVVEPRQNANAPTVVSTCPVDGDLVAPGFEIPIPYAMDDDEAIESFWLEVDGERLEEWTPYNQPAAESDFLWTPSAAAAPGQLFDVRLGVRDFAGNVSEHAVTLQAPTTVLLTGDQTLDAASAGQPLALAAGTFTVTEALDLAELAVLHGAVLESDSNLIGFQVSGRMHVQCGALVDTTGAGYAGADGTAYKPDGLAVAESDAGYSHGGFGRGRDVPDATPGEVYDSVYEPLLAGAGGTIGGGGVITVEAADLVLDGELRARGQTGGGSTHRGGAGGSVLIHTATLSGAGLVDASGGNGGGNGWTGYDGAGGGGRVAIYADDVSGFDAASQVLTRGGQSAGPGTVFLYTADSTYGKLSIDSGPDVSDVPVTELPALGQGAVTATEVAGSDLWVTGESVCRERWLGAWMELRDAAGASLGSFRVLDRDAAGRLLLEGAATAAAAVDYKGEYRFDTVELVNAAGLGTSDPVVGATVTLEGETEIDGELTAAELIVKSGAHVRLAGGNELRVRVLGRLTVEAGAVLDVSGMGYPGGHSGHPDGYTAEGVAPSWPDAGGSHGGSGIAQTATGPAGDVYDSVYRPLLPGAGGALHYEPTWVIGESGGGVLDLEAGELVLDGQIWARGETDTVGGGAGGSIRITTALLSGGGLIDASGGHSGNGCYGSASYGSGGGGRVALTVDSFGGFDPLAQVRVAGGARVGCGVASTYAGPGTLFIETPESTYGDLVIDSGELTDAMAVPPTALPPLGSGMVSAVETADGDLWVTKDAGYPVRWLGTWMELFDGAGSSLGTYRVIDRDDLGRVLLADAGATSSAASFQGRYRFDQITLRNGALLTAADPLAGTRVFDGDTELTSDFAADSVLIKSGATVRPAGTLRFTVSGTFEIEAGGRLDASGLGYAGGVGGTSRTAGEAPAGVEPSAPFMGGSHGGLGASAGGETYDSVSQPRLAGGGGGGITWHDGEAGGGVVDLDVGQLILDGEITVRGAESTTSGGGGGVVLIRATDLTGTGVIDARGSGPCNASGGGGRVALWVDSLAGFDPLQQVLATGNGIACSIYAGPGTVFVHTAASTHGSLWVTHDHPGGTVASTDLPAIGQGVVGTVTADTLEPTAAWIEPQDPATLFSVGTLGMWMRIGGVDYPVIGESADRRGLLLADAAGAVAVGDAYRGYYKFDEVTVAGGALLTLGDFSDVAVWNVDGDSTVVKPDDEPPVFGTIVPADGTVVEAESTIAFSAEVSDNVGVTEVRFDFAGQSFTDTAEPWEWSAAAPAVTAATPVVLTVDAVDDEDNLATATVTVNVHPPPPAVAITQPGDGSIFSTEETFTVDAEVEGVYGEFDVTLAFDGSESIDPAAPYSWTATTPAVVEPTNLPVVVRVSDVSGVIVEDTITVTVEPLATGRPPEVTLADCPADLDLVAPGTALDFAFTASDDEAVEQYALIIDGVETSTVTGISQATVTDTFAWSVPADASPGTVFEIRVEARDNASRVGSAQIWLQVPAAGMLAGDQDLDSSTDGQSLILTNGTFTATEPLDLASLTVARGASLVSLAEQPLDLTVSGTLSVQCGAAVDVTSLGYPGGQVATNEGEAPDGITPAGRYNGGSHGGQGTFGNGSTVGLGEIYDSVYLPRQAGGGGGRWTSGSHAWGGSGGGIVTIAAGAVVIDGEIRSRGQDRGGNYAGGGAGGTVMISAATLAGSGTIDVSGGDYFRTGGDRGGAGGGGRVALYVDDLTGFDAVAQVAARGGTRYLSDGSVEHDATPGTVYTSDASSTYGDLIVDSDVGRAVPVTELPALGTGAVTLTEVSGTDAWITAATPLQARWTGAWMALDDGSGQDLGSYRVLEVDATGRALLAGASGVTGAAGYRGEYRFDSLTVHGGAGLDAADAVTVTTVDAFDQALLPPFLEAADVTIHPGAVAQPASGSELSLTLTGTLTVEAGAVLDLTALGYRGGQVATNEGEAPDGITPAGRYNGGSHGGQGTFGNGSTVGLGEIFDSVYVPRLAGGGGGRWTSGTHAWGGFGGGIVTIAAGTVVIEGEIRSRGQDRGGNYAGGGAGGTVMISAAALTGSGTIDVSGGDYFRTGGDRGGAGGGGRVALHVDDLAGFDAVAQVVARGGTRYLNDGSVEHDAAPGTVYTSDASSTYGDLIVDSYVGRTVPVTELPALATGAITSTEASGTDAWVTASTPLQGRWAGAWMALDDGSGQDLGSYRVLEVDAAGRALLAGASGVTGAAGYRGEYRFDSLTVRGGAGLDAVDAVTVTTVEAFDQALIPPFLTAADVTIHPGALAQPASGSELNLTLTGTLRVEAGALLDLTGLGYRGGEVATNEGEAPDGITPAGRYNGGSHGGQGTFGNNSTVGLGEIFDSVYLPRLAGGGGGRYQSGATQWGGAGGGIVTIAAGAVVIDGEIRSRGQDRGGNYAGAGAGGTVTISAAALTGSGTIDVSGGDYFRNGNDNGGAGGGGRVALYVDDLTGFDAVAQIVARGGTRYFNDGSVEHDAAPGTVYTSDASSLYGDLIVDSDVDRTVPVTELPPLDGDAVALVEVSGTDAWITAAAPLKLRWAGAWMAIGDGSGQDLGTYRVLEVDGAGRALLAGASGVTGAAGYSGEYRFDSLTVRGGARLEAAEPVVATTVDVAGQALIPAHITAVDLTVRSGGVASPGSGSEMRLTLTGTLTVETGAVLDLTGLGYRGGELATNEGEAPDGIAPSGQYNGGGHGGQGTFGNTSTVGLGEIYGSVYLPRQAGGGGGRWTSGAANWGGAGGGIAMIEADAVVIDGEIRSRGQDRAGNWAGAGAGGTVMISAAVLTGGGTIDVSGGDYFRNGNDRGGAGGGGRVALYVDDLTGFDAITQVAASGGIRYFNTGVVEHDASPGTIYTRDGSSVYGDLIIGSEGGRVVPATELPPLAAGSVTALEASGTDAWITVAAPLQPRWAGVWMALADASGQTLGTYRVLEVDGAGRALLGGASGVTGAVDYSGEYRFDSFTVSDGAGLEVAARVVATTVEVAGEVRVPPSIRGTDFTARTGAEVAPTPGGELHLELTGTLTVEAGAVLDVSALGYKGGDATRNQGWAPDGVTPSGQYTGGSHGAQGTLGNSGAGLGEIFDSIYLPWLAGGGGGRWTSGTANWGGSGGGVIIIEAASVLLDGEIRARGEDRSGNWAGTGAGGTVLISASSLSGGGTIDASGGDYFRNGNDFGGLGSGGRLGLYVDDLSAFDAATQILVLGGTRYNNVATVHAHAPPGTVFLFDTNASFGDLVVDNGVPSGVTVPVTVAPLLGTGVVGLVEVDAGLPGALWIEPSDPAALFDLGVTGMWARIDGTDYRVLGQSDDRRRLLLDGAAGTVLGGEAYQGVYKFDQVITRGDATVQVEDLLEAGAVINE